MGTSGLSDMYTPRAEGVHIRQTTRAHVTNTKCNTFTPKIKGIQKVIYLMSPWFEGNIACIDVYVCAYINLRHILVSVSPYVKSDDSILHTFLL